MMTSSNCPETFSTLLVLCEGNPPVTGGFPSQRPVTRSFDVFFDLRLNKRLGKQSRRRWFKTPSGSLWRHCNVLDLWLNMFLLMRDVTDVTSSLISQDCVLYIGSEISRHLKVMAPMGIYNGDQVTHIGYDLLVRVWRPQATLSILCQQGKTWNTCQMMALSSLQRASLLVNYNL